MKKLFAIILIILILSVNVHANVFWNYEDEYFAHTMIQSESLKELSEKYSIGVYVAVTSEYSGDITSCADRFYADRNLVSDGILLYIDPIVREYSIYVHNNAQDIFNSDALDYIEDSILPSLEESNYSSAIFEFEDSVETILQLYSEGEPYKAPYDAVTFIIISIIIGVVVGFITVSVLKSNMKTVCFNDSARSYTVDGSFKLNNSRDIFLYRTVTRVKRVETNTNSSRPSSSGGSFTSRSGKF